MRKLRLREASNLPSAAQLGRDVDAVHKGCWEKFGLAVCRANGIEPDLSVRGLPPFKTRFVEGLKALVFAIFPASLIVRIQNALGSGAKERPNG